MNQTPDSSTSAELTDFRRNRWRALAATALVAASAALAAGAWFASALGGDEPTGAFIVAVGLLAGPAVLVVVLAYFAVIKTPLDRQFAAAVLPPMLRTTFGEFRYRSDEELDPATWRDSGLFPSDLHSFSNHHLVETRREAVDLRLSRLELDQPFSVDRLFAEPDTNISFDGLVAVADPVAIGDFTVVVGPPGADLDGLTKLVRHARGDDETELTTLALDDASGSVFDAPGQARDLAASRGIQQLVDAGFCAAIAVNDGVATIALPLSFPAPDPDPRNPVIDDSETERLGKALGSLAHLIDAMT